MSRTAADFRSYGRKNSVVFRKTNEQFGGLSNMAPGFLLEVNGIRILTSEALYQACRFPHKPEVQRLLIQEGSPMTAKMKSKPHRKDTRPDWDKVRVNIMRWCLRVKLAQNWQKFGDLLLATSDRSIVEESPKDDFWGAKAVDDETLVGVNALGRLLMELREELRSPKPELLKRVEPPNVPQLLLYGKPIGIVTGLEGAQIDPGLFGEPIALGAEHYGTTQHVSGHDSRVPVNEPKTRAEIRGDGAIPKECKRLAEVDFPIAEVSRHAVREKSIRNGHPSTLHLWWARRPLASSRAILLALLWPDPCDPLCPAEFKAKAREVLPRLLGKVGPADEDVRKALLKFIADFANWDNAAHRTYLEVSRTLVKAAYGDGPPLVVDPFAGGGSIPLEALRLGCDTFASDLNPVACLILKLMLEDIPRHDASSYDDLHRICNEIRGVAEEQVVEFYPLDTDGARPVAYFWARTVRCESPHCGAEVPLMSSFWLSKKTTHRRALRPVVLREPGRVPSLSLELFEPPTEDAVPPGTARNGRAQCPCCNGVIPPKRLQALMETQHNGLDVQFGSDGERIGGARLTAVAYSRPGIPGREYRLPSDRDYAQVLSAQRRVSKLATKDVAEGTTAFPNEPVNPVRPSPNARGLSAVTRYGVQTFSDLFNARQKLSLYYLASAIRREVPSRDRTRSVACELVAAALGKRADYSSGGTRWHLTFEKATCTFSKQALSQTWDYVEPTAVGSTSGSYGAGVETVLQAVETLITALDTPGQTSVADACHSPLPDASAAVWFTDPPYYDAIPYADLSDFFYVWLKRALPLNPLLFKTVDPNTALTPKREECVWNRAYVVDGKPKNGAFFEECAARAFAEGRRVLRDEGVGGVVFAHKTTEGWEALLSGLVRGRWVITASWPIATERLGRLQSQGTAALATSVHLICRPRPDDAGVGDWAAVLRQLPTRVGDWMERLQAEGVRGADLVFACIGPCSKSLAASRRSRPPTGARSPSPSTWRRSGRSWAGAPSPRC